MIKPIIALVAVALALSACSAPATPAPTPTQPARSAPAISLPTSTSTLAPTATNLPTIMSSPTGIPSPTYINTATPWPSSTRAPAMRTPVPATRAATQPPRSTSTSAPVRAATVAPINPPSAGGYACANGASCIKGNINADGEKIYHFPGCASYAATQINESAGERWFVTAAEAVAAGWRKAQNCP